MFCCGSIVETTDQDDSQRIYLCQRCGRQGPASEFSECPVLEPACEPEGWIERARLWLAEQLDRIAKFIAPE